MKIGIIILAAGKSERLGRPKQLVEIGETNLVNLSVQSAVGVPTTNIILVLGANTELILPALEVSEAIVVQNSNWQEGIASSMRIGLQALIDIYPQTEAVLFIACDQPYISSSILNALVALSKTSDKGIIVSEYVGLPGIPALFKKKYFDILLKLQGDEGAKKLFKLYTDDVAIVPFKNGEIDIDTEADIVKMKLKYI